MFSEILKIIPQLDNAALSKLEKALSSRFTKVAKKFGNAIGNVFKSGGAMGLILGLVDKLLNPLKEVQEALERTLKTSDDVVVNAKQFNTTSGKLFKLIQLAKANGLDQDGLFMLMTKFQTAVAEAKANPSQPSSVRNFTGEDTASEFFAFIQALRGMEKNQQLLVQQSVFGEKQILKMAEFLQTDMAAAMKEVGLDKASTGKITASLEKLSGLEGLAASLQARRETKDIISKGGVITENMIRSRDKSEQIALDKENKRLASYENLAAISQTVDKIFILIEEGLNQLGKFINFITPAINRIVKVIEDFTKGPMARGIMKWFGSKGD